MHASLILKNEKFTGRLLHLLRGGSCLHKNSCAASQEGSCLQTNSCAGSQSSSCLQTTSCAGSQSSSCLQTNSCAGSQEGSCLQTNSCARSQSSSCLQTNSCTGYQQNSCLHTNSCLQTNAYVPGISTYASGISRLPRYVYVDTYVPGLHPRPQKKNRRPCTGSGSDTRTARQSLHSKVRVTTTASVTEGVPAVSWIQSRS